MKRIVSILLAMALLLSVGGALAQSELSQYSQSIDLSVDYPVFW